MVDVVVVEVHRPFDQAQSESAAAEIEIVLRVVHGGGNVMKTENRHIPLG
jgi:hypothetical protein